MLKFELENVPSRLISVKINIISTEVTLSLAWDSVLFNVYYFPQTLISTKLAINLTRDYQVSTKTKLVSSKASISQKLLSFSILISNDINVNVARDYCMLMTETSLIISLFSSHVPDLFQVTKHHQFLPWRKLIFNNKFIKHHSETTIFSLCLYLLAHA